MKYLIKLVFAGLLPCFMFLNVNGQDVKYVSGHNTWNPDSLGNHRAVVNVTAEGPAAEAKIEWRRRDNPADKEVIVVDAQTNLRITNVKLGDLSRKSGTIIFEPTSGPGKYYLYYMPYRVKAGSNYPNAIYNKMQNTASESWMNKAGHPVKATLLYLESVNAMNSFYPMEVVATENETNNLIKANPEKPYLVFTEDRQYPVKMRHDLPLRWIEKGITGKFSGTAMRGENYSYQLAVYPVKQDLQNVHLTFSPLSDGKGHAIPPSAMSCLNTDGTRYDGSVFNASVDVKKGDVQALWCLVNIPVKTPAGRYRGSATITANGVGSTPVKITLIVKNQIAVKGNIGHPELQTRLTWLNSTLAQKNDVIKPYIPLEVKGDTISLLGRKVILNQSGLPEQIQTFFTPEMTEMTASANNILGEGMHFHVISSENNKDITFKSEGVAFTEENAGTVKWKATNTSGKMRMEVSASLEFDGYMNYRVKLTALDDLNLDDIKFHIPFSKTASRYLMGLGNKGGLRPDTVNWKWDVAHKNQDAVWIGDVNAGLQYSLRDQNYVRPLNTNFYLQKPLLLPTSWGNDNKGGIRIGEKGKNILAENYSGPRTMKKGDVLYYNFTLLVTPFHTINTDFQWATRFYHKYNNVDSIKATGATVINIHHGTPINPFINYPFIRWREMKSYIDSAHRLGLKVKIYNTVRELSNSAYETFPMRSLGHEIYSTGKGGGYSWLQEHIGEDYIAAWYVPEYKDAAIINSGMSRWHNYYVEGMNWLVQNVGIDGIYLDDVAFDRVTMKRIKRVLTQNGHPGIIDLHSANQYDKNDGFNNSANLYMEHFPYLNRLWFGEYFDYEKNGPDFFLTEVSGIPFGLMGEMLQGGGNPWRGMIYGMTNRMPWSDNADPRPIWKAWDDFGMQGTKMIGYWVNDNPVKTSDPKVLATVYKKAGKAMIAIASWADSDAKIKLNIDFKALGIDPAKASLTATAIKNFQPEQQFNLNDEIPVKKGKGWLLILK
ncbi:MAG TPA: glycoside hydrolase domain-containing protein [Mucilaginibacter sp.]|nr:glycoside hydrolase domain-containing protein [Mucilaginibacter sp.]